MKIYEPTSLKISAESPKNFQNTLDFSQLDLSSISAFNDKVNELEDNNITKIEETFMNFSKDKDVLLNLDPGTSYGREVIEKKKAEYGINDELFNVSSRDLKDPMRTSKIQYNIKLFMSDPEVNEVLKESELIKRFEKTVIPKLERKNPSMALVAKKDLLDIKNGAKYADGSMKTIYDITPEHYEPINFSKILAEEIKTLPQDTKVESNPDGNGYIIYSETKNFRVTGDDFAKYVADKYSDDQRVVNLFRSKVDLFKPKDQQMINDPDGIDNFLKEEATKVYNMYDSKSTKTFIKDNKFAVDDAKTENKKELEQQKFQNRVSLEKEKRVTKKTIPGSSGKSGGGSGRSSTNNERFNRLDHGKYGSAVGNELFSKGYNVNDEQVVTLDKAFSEENIIGKINNPDGSISYKYYDNNGNEATMKFAKTTSKKSVGKTTDIKKKWGK